MPGEPLHIGLFDSEWRGHHTTYASLTARYLLDSGHSVTFFTSSNHARLDDLPTHPAFDVVELRPLSVNSDEGSYLGTVGDQWRRLDQFRRGMAVAHERDIDIVHLLTLDWFQVPTRVGTFAGIDTPPLVATLHRDYRVTDDHESGTQVTDRAKRLLKSGFDWGNRAAMKSCLDDGTITKLVVHPPTMRDRLRSSMGVAPERITSIPAPTPEPESDLSPREARRQLNLPTDTPILLFFGALAYAKGPDVLAAALREVDVPVAAVFAGGPDYFDGDDVADWARGTPETVEFVARTEYVPEADVYPYFAAADVAVLPYRRRYGTSGNLRRAGMVGTPVIGSAGTDVGGIIDAHGIGVTFERGDPTALAITIESVLGGKESVTNEALNTYAETVHWQSVGERYETLYRNLFG
ncbi:glycosyltransferase family 4 protein [Salinibaculum rarum]|uniref:glycosyltransferase family 4 protein n=1 Tax=Salinibaculum rarum TaxID=3058903 RepID=UPI00265E026D|nr:glycosyltransferase family 4 protein [Salinibaculum sp. KK48]